MYWLQPGVPPLSSAAVHLRAAPRLPPEPAPALHSPQWHRNPFRERGGTRAWCQCPTLPLLEGLSPPSLRLFILLGSELKGAPKLSHITCPEQPGRTHLLFQMVTYKYDMGTCWQPNVLAKKYWSGSVSPTQTHICVSSRGSGVDISFYTTSLAPTPEGALPTLLSNKNKGHWPRWKQLKIRSFETNSHSLRTQ